MKRKKEGASLIVVVIVFMFVTTVSMAMLSMVAGNYKARVMESKRIENLYASDSGLDVAYNIMAKTFDAATKYGYYKVQALKSPEGNSDSIDNDNKYKDLEADIEALKANIVNLKNEEPSETRSRKDINDDIEEKNNLITESKNLEQLLLNEEFKRTFRNFIAQSLENGENEPAPDKLRNSIENHKFFDVGIRGTNYNDIQFTDKTVDFGINNNNAAPTLTLTQIHDPIVVSGTSEIKRISISQGHHKAVEITITPEQKYENITVTSNFYTEKFNGNTNSSNRTNERDVVETFDMVIPNFDDVYYQEAASDMNQYLATKDRALTVHGNMNVTGADNFTVNNGEIFVEGETPNVGADTTRSYKKYNGGIMIANSKNVTFNDNVITRNSFNIRNNAEVTIDKNLYGRNVYLGGKYYRDDLTKGLNELAVNSKLYVNRGEKEDATKGQIAIDNDLAFKAQNSQIYIKDFYGINDKNITSKNAYGNLVDKVKSSSSIIVNTNDNESRIDINNSAYIMGTAHINTNERDESTNQYQTGESGAVIGNYIAYSVPLDETEQFGYYDPLQLVDKVWNTETNKFEEATVFDKANHFTDYWNREIDKGQGHTPNTGGIIWPKNLDGSINSGSIWSSGAIVYEIGGNKNVLRSHYISDLENDDGTGAIYNKQAEFAQKVYRFNQEATKKYDYDYEKLTDFSDLVNTHNIASDTSYELDKQNNKGEYAIFNGDDTKEIKIEKSTDGVEKIDINTTNDIVIYVTNKGTDLAPKYDLSSVIVTAGKLSIDEDITINGCIIVDGDLNINKSDVTINYDSGVVERVQAKNSGIFETVFGGWIIPPDNNSIDADIGNLASSYDLSHFLEKKLWKIRK
ncbi:hypothetical protein DIC82_00825 [Clostridium beijerinckii]|nr:hypothetical protein DIC82_00825 [Clostridium beijerinckii]